MVDTLTGLISIFEREELDFSKNNTDFLPCFSLICQKQTFSVLYKYNFR